MPTVSLRYFNVFGPRQDPTSEYAAVIPKFITRIMAKEPPVIYGDGTQTRDFTYVVNVVAANILAATEERCVGEVLNVSTGKNIDLIGLAQMIGGAMGNTIRPIFKGPREGDIKHSFGDITKAKRLLGYDTTVGLEEGLSRTVTWYLDGASR
jgi:nucleoside-diphosphate-sugar epimerase